MVESEQIMSLDVIVTTHPDDESMFFVPCLRHLLLGQTPVWLLCLTTGNYDGLGEQRSSELRIAAEEVLGMDKVVLLDDLAFQDDPASTWNIEATAKGIQEALTTAMNQENISHLTSLNLITFDQDGVSGHSNHRDTYFAVRHLYLQQQMVVTKDRLAENVTAWSLESVHNPIAKYIPILEWIRLLLCWLGWQETSTAYRSQGTVLYRLFSPSLSWKAMAAHQSQFVWYRRLFVIFSCYTFVNRIRSMEDVATRKPNEILR